MLSIGKPTHLSGKIFRQCGIVKILDDANDYGKIYLELINIWIVYCIFQDQFLQQLFIYQLMNRTPLFYCINSIYHSKLFLLIKCFVSSIHTFDCFKFEWHIIVFVINNVQILLSYNNLNIFRQLTSKRDQIKTTKSTTNEVLKSSISLKNQEYPIIFEHACSIKDFLQNVYF